MQFLNPSILFALAAIAIPIIIHLFNFRRFKKVEFTNVKFLKEIKEQTKSKSKLKHILILLSRILAIIFLVLTFAQPFMPYNKSATINEQKNIGVYIDNSFRMSAIGAEGKLSDQAKRIAQSLIKSLKPNDEISLISNDFTNSQERPMNKLEALDQLEFVNESPNYRTLEEIYARFIGLRGQKQGMSNELFIISDFQENFLDNVLELDSNVDITLIPLRSNEKANIYIDSCWFETPFRQINTPEQLIVRIKNTSKNDLKDIPIRLDVNGVQKAIASTSVAANSTVDTSISFTISNPGWQQSTVSINDHPITFDNTYYFSFEVKEQVNVLCLYENDSNVYFSSLFSGDPTIQLKQIKNGKVDYSTFLSQDLIVLSGLSDISSGLVQELEKFVDLGRTVLILPSTTIDMNSYNKLTTALGTDAFGSLVKTKRKVSSLNFNLKLFEGIFETVPENMDLPVVTNYFLRKKTNNSKFDYVMQLENGDPFLNLYSEKNGNVYILYSALESESNNFGQHALFVPIMYKICFTSQLTGRLTYVVGQDERIIIPTRNTDNNIIKIKKSDKDYEFIPGNNIQGAKTALMVHGQINEAGHYLLRNDKELGAISFNYSRKESNTNLMPLETILEQTLDRNNVNVIDLNDKNIEAITDTMGRIVKGESYWRTCLIMALIFFGLEIFLIRFLS